MWKRLSWRTLAHVKTCISTAAKLVGSPVVLNTDSKEKEMTAHNHYCKSCANARKGAPVPYEDLDPEMVDIVKALNTIPGMRTLDSCFGHSGSGDTKKAHQSNVYIGLAPALGEGVHRLQHFWGAFFESNYGKLDMPTGYVQFSL